MRWVVAFALLLAVPAHAKELVIEEPSQYYVCPKGKTWDEVAKCLRQHGRPEIVRTLAGAKLVRLDQRDGDKWVDTGLYLYVAQKTGWAAAGNFQGGGTDYELLDLAPLTIGKHTGYRLDIGQATPLYVQLDGVTTSLALRRGTYTLLCNGIDGTCLFVTRNCEVLVHGNAYWTFRGAMTIDGNEVKVAGDRGYAGPFCSQAERVFLGWPQT